MRRACQRTTNKEMTGDIGGREFDIASISMIHVANCSNVNNVFPTIRSRECLNNFTAVSEKPPNLDDLGGNKHHVILS